MKQVDETSRKIIRLAQGDLPLDPRPYDSWARQLGMEPAALIDRLRGLMAEGIVRGVKAVLRHRAAGFSFGAMVCWAVPEHDIQRAGREIAAREKVSHCYERPGFGGYRLFSMIHGRSEEEVLGVISDISKSLSLDSYKVYWSVRELKKSSMVYFGEDPS